MRSQSPTDSNSFAFTTGAYGDRPTFLLSRHTTTDGYEVTLYELSPKSIANARKQRYDDVGKSSQIQIRDLSDAVAGEEKSNTLDSEYDWDDWCAIKVATLRNTPLNEIFPLVRSTLSDCTLDSGRVLRGDPDSLPLPEAAGVRLSIAFEALKPVRRRDRLRAICDGIERMSLGECYYWRAKARSPTTDNGMKALRTLLAGNIQ